MQFKKQVEDRERQVAGERDKMLQDLKVRRALDTGSCPI